MTLRKGIISGLLLAAITANTAGAAIINEPIKEEKIDDTSKKITISGTIPLKEDNNLTNRIVTLEVLTKEASQQILEADEADKYNLIDEYVIDKTKIEYIAQTEADENGDYSFDYTKKSASGDYIIRIGYYAKNDENEYVMTYNYKSPEELVGLYDELNQAYSGNSTAELKAVLDKYSDLNVISIDDWDALNALGDTALTEFVLGYMLEQEVPESEDEIKQYIKDAEIVELFNNKSTDKIKEALADQQIRTAVGIDEDVYTWLISGENAKAEEEVYKKLASKSMDNMTFEKIKELVHFTVVSEELNSVLWQKVLNILEKNNSVLGIDMSAQSDFGKLTDTQKNKAATNIKAKISRAVSLKDIKDIFDAEVKAVKNEEDNEESGGGSSTGGGGYGGNYGGSDNNRKPNSSGTTITYPSQNVSNNTQSAENDEENAVFSDLQDYEWAVEAIARLKEKGILNGNEDGTYAPYNPVKREEFVKMIIEALGLKNVSQEFEFTDVDSTSWYYPYVCGGVYYKLINGMGDGSFGIGQSIKRADVAVIIQRLLKMYGKEYTWKTIVYKDVIKEELEYAYDAIYCVSESKLMNGTGDVTFEPFKSLTRAEAAVLIDRVVALLENN